jgi:hypothetical protein
MRKGGVMKYGITSVLVAVCVLVTSAAGIDWTGHEVVDYYNGPSSLMTFDIDQDGALDILGTSIHSNKISWWKNEGGTPIGWTEYDIDLSILGSAFAYPGDIDNDGDIDVAGAGWYANAVNWYENEGGTPIAWTKRTIDGTFLRAHEVYVCDMDADGDSDLVGAAADVRMIAWWRNDGGDPVSWEKCIIDTTFDGARSARAGDFNNDGLVDVVGAALLDHDVTVWYNSGDTAWIEQIVDGNFLGAHMVRVSDVDSDGDLDIVGAAYMVNDIAWWRNDGGDPVVWTKQIIDGNFTSALGVHAEDIDGDGHVDVVGTSEGGDLVSWWRNDGNVPITWTEEIIATGFDGAWPVHAADIDDDGDMDVLAGANYGDEVMWWESDLTGIAEYRPEQLQSNNHGASIIAGNLVLPADTRYVVLDVSGRIVDRDDLKPGIYFICQEQSIVRKVVKVR